MTQRKNRRTKTNTREDGPAACLVQQFNAQKTPSEKDDGKDTDKGGTRRKGIDAGPLENRVKECDFQAEKHV